MALVVRVFINDRMIAEAGVQNMTEEGDISNYEGRSVSLPSPITGKPTIRTNFKIEGHNRNQSARALVEKMAKAIAEQENK